MAAFLRGYTKLTVRLKKCHQSFLERSSRYISLGSWCRSHQNDEKTFVPASADAVVIGGGCIGCSVAYNLSKQNIGKVLLVEKASLTAGTTWHTGGLLWNIQNHRTLTEMLTHTRELVSRILPDETGFDSGWLQTGGLFVTRNEHQLNGMEAMHCIGSEYGVPSRIVDPDEISKIHPLMNTDGLVGALYCPQDGSLDPSTLCTSYVKAGSKYGLEVFENCDVTNIQTETGPYGVRKVVAVETNRGRIKTDNIVNCTGAWAPYIATMVGLAAPQVIYKIGYVVTQGISGLETTPHIRDAETSIYYKRQGDALLFGGYNKDMDLVEEIAKDFAFGLYETDWPRIEPVTEAAIKLLPDVGKVGIRSTIHGPETYTTDGFPLMGESPDVRGFFYGSAFNGYGMMLSGGAGRQIAHWVAHGAPETDLHCSDIARFSSKQVTNRSWLIESCHEHVITRYHIHHPNKQLLAGRGVRKTPLHEVHLDNGASFTCVHGWEVPLYFIPGKKFPLLNYDFYGSYGHAEHQEYRYRDQMNKDCSFEFSEVDRLIEQESIACHRSVGLADLSHLSKFRISGDQTIEAVACLFPSDVTSLATYDTIKTLLLTKGGRILTHVIVRKEDDGSFLINGPAQMEETILRHMKHFLGDRKLQCEIENVTEKQAILTLLGPKSNDVLSSVGLSAEDFVGRKAVAGKEVKIYRSYSHSGYYIYCDTNDVKAVYDVITSSSPYPANVGIRALKSLAMESGKHSLLSSYLSGADPHEAKFMTLDSFSHDGGRDYIGKGAIARNQTRIPEKEFTWLSVANSKIPIFPGDLIWKNGEYIGTVEEAGCGYKEQKYSVLGYINRSDQLSSSDVITVGRSTQRARAEII